MTTQRAESPHGSDEVFDEDQQQAASGYRKAASGDEQEGRHRRRNAADTRKLLLEAACVRFFTGNFSNLPCEAQTDCSLDELCSLKGFCVPRSSEARYCMATCDSNDDCRDGYECRTRELMISHGGEPVLEPGKTCVNSPKFCATAP